MYRISPTFPVHVPLIYLPHWLSDGFCKTNEKFKALAAYSSTRNSKPSRVSLLMLNIFGTDGVKETLRRVPNKPYSGWFCSHRNPSYNPCHSPILSRRKEVQSSHDFSTTNLIADDLGRAGAIFNDSLRTMTLFLNSGMNLSMVLSFVDKTIVSLVFKIPGWNRAKIKRPRW